MQILFPCAFLLPQPNTSKKKGKKTLPWNNIYEVIRQRIDLNITGIPEKCQLSWEGLGWFSMEIEIATGCWRQELEPFPGRSEPFPTPSSLLESLG